MNRLTEELQGLPVRILGVNMQESPRRVAQIKKRHKLQFEILLDRAGTFGRAYGIYGLPQVMIIDKRGRLRFRDYAPPRGVTDSVKALLAEE